MTYDMNAKLLLSLKKRLFFLHSLQPNCLCQKDKMIPVSFDMSQPI